NYNKISFDDFHDEALKETTKGGWTAIVQHYFVTAWIPDANSTNHLMTRANKDKGEYFIGFTSPDIVVNAGMQNTVNAKLYAGPKVQKELAKLSTGLELTVDYGFLWFISQFLFWVLQLLHGFLGNWGWSIVFLTLFVKLAFFHLSATSYKSMANMRRVMPEMQRIKEQYGNDRQKMSMAMMELYQKEKINPVAGCLPILVQMPVFLALYWTLMESVELRHAPWLLWITDLAAMDKFFVLPLIMGATMYIQQLLNPQPTDPMQAKVLKLMPIIFTVFMLWFPSGLVLYWVVNNVLSIAQQWVITRQIEGAAAKK
ncbi:MAG TPA: membrane protein insertase YidC, partial [Agitococcus sp.]|nr:membrane protein insertase YidC [Agitococcus sp.]